MAKHLLKRPSGYYFRYIVPQRYESLFPRRELRYTLRTQSRRAASQLARAVLYRVERLFEQMARNRTVLDGLTIRETIRRYIGEERERLVGAHLARPLSKDEHEAHQGILLDMIRELRASTASSNFRPDTREKVCRLFGIEPGSDESGDSDFDEALRLWVLATAELYEEHLRMLDGEAVPGDGLEALLQPEIAPRSMTPAAQAPPLSEALDQFLADRETTRGITANTSGGYRQYTQAFIDTMGDLPADSVTPAVAARFRDRLLRLPANRAKRPEYRDKAVAELERMDIPPEHRMSETTVNQYLVHLSTMYEWLVQRQHVGYNPFKKLAVKAEKKAYPAFTTADLEQLFSSELYTPGSSWFEKKTTTAGYWWLMLLAVYTGARAGELVQMRLEDVRKVDGVLLASIVEDAETGQRVKSAAAVRNVPIHPRLLELGFEDYLEALKASGADRVLEGVRLGKRKAADPVSKWFGRYKERCLPGFAETRKVLHSARSTFYTAALNDAALPPLIIKQLVGHSQEDELGAGIHYNKGAGAQMLYEEIAKISYPCGALDGLRQDWRRMELHR